MGSYCLMGGKSFSFLISKKFCGHYGADGSKTMWTYLTSINCPLENGFDFSCVILQQFKKKKNTLENQRIRIQPHRYFYTVILSGL